MGTAYEPTTWVPGVTAYSANEMNKLSQGIAGAAPVGQVIMSFGPQTGYVPLDGSHLARTTYSALFDHAVEHELIGPGKPFGEGDGETTFTVPDWRGRFPIGADTGRPVGAQGGSESHAHGNPATSSGGSHTHSQSSTGSAGSHAHSNPNTSSAGSHAHSQDATGQGGSGSTGSAGSHSHTTGGASTSASKESGGVQSPSMSHTHSVSTGGSHTHSVSDHAHSNPNTNSGGSHAHSIGNTGTTGSHTHSNPDTASSGTHSHGQADTDSQGHLPPWAAVLWLIRY